MKICVFCSANEQIDPAFFTLTEELGKWAAENGHSIVYGGVNQGLMECVAKASKEAGGRTIGVVPMIVEKSGRISDYVDVEIPCDNLTDRKQLMMDQSDVFIALPGGIGTLDEMFTVAASATIGYHQKPLILYNMKGFWDSLIALLDDLQAKGMIRGNWRDYIKTADSIEQIGSIIGTINKFKDTDFIISPRDTERKVPCLSIESRVNPCLKIDLSYESRLSANCSSCASSAAFMRERIVTIGSTISQSFRLSIIERITLPAVGIQLPFSTIPKRRRW